MARAKAKARNAAPEPPKPAFNPYDVFFAVIAAQCRQHDGTFKFPKALLSNANEPATITTTITDLDVIFQLAKP